MNQLPEKPTGWTRRDFFACALSMIVGLQLAVSPHLAFFWRYQTLEYLGYNNDLMYVNACRSAYHGELTLRDPNSGKWEQGKHPAAWLQFVPSGWLAAKLNVPLILLPLLWRIGGGLGFGFALFYLFRQLLTYTRWPAAWALGCAVVCLSDAGFVSGRSLVQSAQLPWEMWHGTTPFPGVWMLFQFRVVTPLLNVPFVFLLLGALASPRQGIRAACLGILALAFCYWLYFYLWTGAVVCLVFYLAYIAVRFLRTPKVETTARQGLFREGKFAAIVLVGGSLLGAPQVFQNWNTFKAPEFKPILERMHRPVKLFRTDRQSRMYVLNFWGLGKLIFGGAGILLLQRRRLVPLWCFVFADYLLANSALVTGLEFENWHWLHFAMHPLGQILVLVIFVELFERAAGAMGRWIAALWLVPALFFTVASVWQPYEALHAPLAIRYHTLLEEFRPLRPTLSQMSDDYTIAGPEQLDVVMAFSKCAPVYLHYGTQIGSTIPTETVHELHALNGWLRGFDAQTYAETARSEWFLDLQSKLPELQIEAIVAARLGMFQRLLTDPEYQQRLMTKHRPGYLLTASSEQPSPARGGPWLLVQKSADWAIWRREAATIK